MTEVVKLGSLLLLALVMAPAAVTAAPRSKAAGGKSTPACGARILPLVVGNEWTYEQTAPAIPAVPEIAKIAPNAPKKLVVSVTAIDAKGSDTVVSIAEQLTYDLERNDTSKHKFVERAVTGTITCNTKGKFDISPELFFFAGEPGGFEGMKFDSFDRKKETSLKLTRGSIGEDPWIEEITSKWTATPAPASGAFVQSGTLDLERSFIPQVKEPISTKLGQWSAEKLALTTTGRISLDHPRAVAEAGATPKPAELPANWVNTIWLVDSVGVVQTLNRYAQQYVLVDAQLK